LNEASLTDGPGVPFLAPPNGIFVDGIGMFFALLQ
jgi:hypothetical protein